MSKYNYLPNGFWEYEKLGHKVSIVPTYIKTNNNKKGKYILYQFLSSSYFYIVVYLVPIQTNKTKEFNVKCCKV